MQEVWKSASQTILIYQVIVKWLLVDKAAESLADKTLRCCSVACAADSADHKQWSRSALSWTDYKIYQTTA